MHCSMEGGGSLAVGLASTEADDGSAGEDSVEPVIDPSPAPESRATTTEVAPGVPSLGAVPVEADGAPLPRPASLAS